jgi:hypothetical protein
MCTKRLLILAMRTSISLFVGLLNTLPTHAQASSWEVIYLYRDESAETTQGYQLSSLVTSGDNPQPRPLYRFPIDGIIVPWDVPPPAAVSPDEKMLALIQWDEKVGGALLINLDSGTVKPLPAIKITNLFDTTILGWLPNGAGLILYHNTGYNTESNGGEVMAYDLAQDKLTTLLTLSDVLSVNAQVTLSPDTTKLVYCTTQVNGGCGGYALRGLGGSPEKPITLPPGTACPGYPALKWSPDSRKIALDCSNASAPNLTLLDATDGTVTAYPVSNEVNDMVWSPDGSRLLLDLCAGDEISAYDAECGPLQFMDAATGALTPGPTFARSDARRLYWLGDTLVLDESAGGGQQSTLSFYDMLTTKQKTQIAHNSSLYQDASIIVIGVRPLK